MVDNAVDCGLLASEDPATLERPRCPQITLEARKLGYEVDSKEGSVQILRNVNALFMPGKCTALMGPSGAGYLSLLAHCVGLGLGLVTVLAHCCWLSIGAHALLTGRPA